MTDEMKRGDRRWVIRKRSALAWCAVAALLVAWPGLASAQPVDDLIRQGVELRQRGDDAAALVVFQRAHASAPSGRTLTQIGFAEQALGRFVDAHRHLTEALQAGGSWVREHRATIQAALEIVQGHLGQIEVLGTEGATVRVDGREVGRLPLAPFVVPVGSFLVEVQADGFHGVQRRIDVGAGRLSRLDVDLTAVSLGSASVAAVTVSGGAGSTSGPDEGLLGGGIVSFVVGGLGLGLYAVTGSLALRDYDRLAEGCGATASCPQTELDSLSTLNLVADLGLAVGATGVALGALLTALAFTTPGSSDSVSAFGNEHGGGFVWRRTW